MTEHKHLKALIRARMARTGESYTAARRHIVGEGQPAPALRSESEFRAHDKHCMTAVFTPDGAHLISGGFGGQARIWTLDGTQAGELIGHESAVSAIRVSAEGGTVVTAASDKSVRVWDLPARRERFVLGSHRKQVLALDLDAPRERVWSGGHDGKLNAWNLATRELDAALDMGGTVNSVAVRPSDGVVAAAAVGAGIAILDAAGQELARIGEGTGIIGSVAWAADGSSLLASTQGHATVWAADDWEAVRTLDSGAGSMLPAAISPDGSRIALGWDNHVGLWSADDSQPPSIMDGLPKGVYGLSFSPDGKKLAGAAADGRVRVWSVT